MVCASFYAMNQVTSTGLQKNENVHNKDRQTETYTRKPGENEREIEIKKKNKRMTEIQCAFGWLYFIYFMNVPLYFDIHCMQKHITKLWH